MPKAPRELHDLVLVGGGPAAAAAALYASKQKASVLVIEKETLPRSQAHCGWLGPAGMELCQELGITAARSGATRFKGLRLHSWDLKRNAFVDDTDLRGWLVDRSRFDQALLKKAAGAGTKVLHGVTVRDLRLGEERAVVTLSDGSEVAGKVVLIADGATSPTGRMANLICAGQQPDLPACLFVQYATKEKAAGLDVVIGTGRVGQLATIVRLGKTASLKVVTRATEIPIEEQFRAFCQNALKCGLLPEGDPGPPLRMPCPGGAALDMDTHIGKRCLLIGGAGGFVAAFSNEGVYPGMRSGLIAVDTALRALQAPVLQDELASFGVVWRGELADYLRMPNTDLGLLMPLVFNNEQMSRRVARAFLLGQSF